jgi:hypothetical protein
MSVIAYAGEQVKGRDGKVIATLAQDIHSGDLNVQPNWFVMNDAIAPHAFIPEEVMEFVRGKLSSPSPEVWFATSPLAGGVKRKGSVKAILPKAKAKRGAK